MKYRRASSLTAAVLMIAAFAPLSGSAALRPSREASAHLGVAGGQAAAQTGQQPPCFQSSVEVTPVDVTVVDNRGQPIRDLSPADFSVRIDGSPRRVVSAEWVSLVTAGKTAGPPTDLVGTLLLLVSKAGDWITGQTISVDGGWVKRL